MRENNNDNNQEYRDLISECFLIEPGCNVGLAAMLLAITPTIIGEERVKRALQRAGVRFVVTETGGKSFQEFQDKTTRAVIGACLNSGVIKKTAYCIHALLHATEEAKRGLLVNASTSTSLAIKIAIVRDDHWIAVAMFGQSAIHPLTNHYRAGLGVMHIGKLEEGRENEYRAEGFKDKDKEKEKDKD